jgi:hypothetical protein
MGGGVSALGAGALGMVGQPGAGVAPPANKRFLRLVPCLVPLCYVTE